jgi:hypothetical protein
MRMTFTPAERVNGSHTPFVSRASFKTLIGC